MFPIKNGEDLEKIEELVSTQNKVEDLRLKDRLGEQNYHENTKKTIRTID